MMKHFCVLFLQWSRYRGQTCSRGTEYTGCDCMKATDRTCTFTPGFFTWESDGMGEDGGGWGWWGLMRTKHNVPTDVNKEAAKPLKKHFSIFAIITVSSCTLHPLIIWSKVHDMFAECYYIYINGSRSNSRSKMDDWTGLRYLYHPVKHCVDAPAPSIYNHTPSCLDLCWLRLTAWDVSSWK